MKDLEMYFGNREYVAPRAESVALFSERVMLESSVPESDEVVNETYDVVNIGNW